MIEGVPVEALNGAGVVGIALLVAIAIARGWLVTAREVERIETSAREALEKAEHDRDEWRAESRIKDAQIGVKDEQIRERDRQISALSEVGDLLTDLFRTMKRLAAGRSEVDG